MSNKSTDNDKIESALESLENTAATPSNSSNDGVTGVEVVKGDTVVYEDGDFDDYNAEKNIESDKDDKSDKEGTSDKEDESEKEVKEDKFGMTIANIYQWATKLKDDLIADKGEKSATNEKDSAAKSDNKSDDKEASNSVTVANIYQWASKLKDDFTAEASTMAHGVSEKAVAIMLKRLLDNVDTELEAFDKKGEDSEELPANAKEEREKIVAKKDKYQSMIDQLQS